MIAHSTDCQPAHPAVLPPFLTPAQVCEITTLSEPALAQLRYTGKGPVFLKPTARKVLYPRDGLLEWLNGSARRSTGDAP